jgi:hypothetical protein
VTSQLERAQTRQCTRYGLHGERCENTTGSADGWCRQVGCPGYVRPIPLKDEDHVSRPPRGTAKHIAATGAIPVALEIDEVETVRVSQRARDSFRYHHRGGDAEAEVQLRAMLEDFLLRSARSTSPGGFVQLAHSGYELVLDPSLGTVTGYRTVHRERTWEQVKAKVPSRYHHRSGKWHATGPAPEPGPALEPQDVLAQLDPAAVHLTGRVRRNFARLRELQGHDDESLDAVLRAELADGLPSALVGPGSDENLVHLLAGDVTWLISCDALTAVGLRLTRDAQPPES